MKACLFAILVILAIDAAAAAGEKARSRAAWAWAGQSCSTCTDATCTKPTATVPREKSQEVVVTTNSAAPSCESGQCGVRQYGGLLSRGRRGR